MKYAILVALKAELQLQQENIFYTGVGKINSARVATEVVLKHRPKNIINYGTAGTLKNSRGKQHQGLVQCTQFVQRDMDTTPLGTSLGETPFEKGSKIITSTGTGLVCGSGDSFVTQAPTLNADAIEWDVVEMEAYAIAKVCRHYGVNFICYKYITDSADDAAPNSWKENLTQGSALFVKELEKIKTEAV